MASYPELPCDTNEATWSNTKIWGAGWGVLILMVDSRGCKERDVVGTGILGIHS